MDFYWFLGMILVAIGVGIKIQKKLPRRSTGPYPLQVVDAFDQLLYKIGLCEWYKQQVEDAAEEIREYLDSAQKHCSASNKFEIDDIIVAGSVGKGTAIHYGKASCVSNDVDLIIYLKNTKPPFSDTLKTFAQILDGWNEVSGIIPRQYSVEFNIWIKDIGDVKMDLLIATDDYDDCSKAVVDTATSQMDEKQRRQLLVGQNKVVSCNFAAETMILIRSFVKNKYVLNVVRLAKYWNGMVDMTKFAFIPARSYIIEIVAIEAQQTVLKQKKRTDLISGFRRFLEKMSSFRKLDISLTDNAIAEADKQFKKPIIRDPVNPYNNLTEGIPTKAMEIWESQAKKTLDMLKRLRNEKIDLDLEENKNFVDDVFAYKL